MCLGIPGKVLDIRQENDLPMGKVDFGGVVKEICLAYTPEARVGDYVIVHVGFAISRVERGGSGGDIFLYRADRAEPMKYVNEYRDELGATAGLSSSAESTVGQANRGTPVAEMFSYIERSERGP